MQKTLAIAEILKASFLIILSAILIISCKTDADKLVQQDLKMIEDSKKILIDSTIVTFTDTVRRLDPKTNKEVEKIFYKKEVVYKVPNTMPFFPGCPESPIIEERYKCSNSELMKYIGFALNYPKEAYDKNLEGVSVLRFIVDEKGRPIQEEIVKSIGYGTDNAVLNVIKRMRKENINWEPGKVNDKPVKVMLSVPVRFKMN